MELRPSQLADEWKKGRFRAIYYFLGETSASAGLAAQLKSLLKPDDFNYRDFHEQDTDPAAIVSEALTLPVFAQRRLVIVSNPKLVSNSKAALAAYLKDPVESTTLALVSDEIKIDSKDALMQAALTTGVVCASHPLKEEEAQQRLRSEVRKAGKLLSEEAAMTLVAEAGTEWAVLSQELEKALLFSSKSNEITQKDILECLGYRKSTDPFAISKLIGERKLKSCLGQLHRMFEYDRADEQAFKALTQIQSVIGKQVRAKRLLKAGISPEVLFKTLRLHSYWDRDFLGKLHKLSENRLMEDLNRCLETEVALKSKSWIDPKIEMEQLIVDLCGTRS